jgi:8-oxo-dGTP diphosphatase
MKRIEVAAAVLRRADGAFLLGLRPEGTPYAGCWEFPGGKLEPGETPHHALVRELQEELGIQSAVFFPWITVEHTYPDVHVRLHCFEVRECKPGPEGLERHVHAAFHWQESPQAPPPSPMLPTNVAIFRALSLPRQMGITHAADVGVKTQIAMAKKALEQGLPCLQVREPALSENDRLDLIAALKPLAAAHAARLILNGDPQEAQALGLDGVHLSGQRLLALDARPDLPLVGASCHTRAELEKAAHWGLDYAFLGPVFPTQTHPGRPGLGWEAFSRLVSGLSIPVLALGGLSPFQLQDAQRCGAHGVAGIRGFWS